MRDCGIGLGINDEDDRRNFMEITGMMGNEFMGAAGEKPKAVGG